MRAQKNGPVGNEFFQEKSNVFVDFLKIARIICFCMDTKKDSKIPKYGVDPEMKQEKLIVGAKQLRKALENGRAKRVWLAENADPAITEPLEALCRKYRVSCIWVPSKQDLGKSCGIEVGAAAAAAVD